MNVHATDASILASVKPKSTGLKRGIVFTILGIFCVACFWYALSGVNPPPCPLSKDSAASSAQCGTGSGGQARPSSSRGATPLQGASKTTPTTGNSRTAVGPNAGSGAGNRGPAAGSSSISGGGAGDPAMSNIASNNRTGGASSNPLQCRSQCEAGIATCQAQCYRGSNVTTQTQTWITCMQSCSARMSVCANACTSGIAPPSNPQVPVAHAPTANAPAAPSRSARTPSLPIQMPDSSSGSSSSSQ